IFLKSLPTLVCIFRDALKNIDLGFDNVVRMDANIPPDWLSQEQLAINQSDINPPKMTAILATHKYYDIERKESSIPIGLDMQLNESEGTNKLFAMAGHLIDSLENGKIFLIDELDARLHPLMTREIISLFNSNETNPNKGQLIFTTHDTNLLSNKFFRRDQVWFTEKDKYGVTHLYSLAEYKVRNDASFESDYIQGRYGAVPFIGDLSHLIG
ncbi:AAA family ATPase, partial [Tumidithrix elongata RA019]|nr:AAA family ATPase [Tumidithrix elongata RA019]